MGFEKIDLVLWKDIQDKFSREIGLPIRTVDLEGKDIALSGDLPFISQLILSKKPEFYNQNHGLKYIVKNVSLYDKKIGYIICGPVGYDSSYDFKLLSEHLDVGCDELISAAMKISSLDSVAVAAYSKCISVLTEIVPKLAYQKQKKDEEIRELSAVYNIARKINSSLDLDKVIYYVMATLAGAMNANDCALIISDGEGEKKYYLNESSKERTVIEKHLLQNEKNLALVKSIKDNFGIEVDALHNSLLFIPLKLKEQSIGAICIYYKSLETVLDKDIKFITIIADQVAMAIANAQKFTDIKEIAVIDKLTGVSNRRHFMELLELQLQKPINKDQPISLALIDIDDFGKYNNTHGHQKGDLLLKELSNILQKTVGEHGIVGRYGGEEFVILMINLKPSQAVGLALKIRESIEGFAFEGKETQPGGKITISMGLVICLSTINSYELIKEADESLYRAKNKGKNQVIHKVWLGRGLKTEV